MIVSIVIPTSNAEDTIENVLNSILSQDYKEYEVIIIDNGSKDRTEEIVKKIIEKKKADIKYYKYEKQLGHAGAINEGIMKASGDLILILHDDVVLGGNNWLSEMVKVMEREDVGIASSLFVTPVKELSGINKVFSYVYILGWHDTNMNLGIQEVMYSGLNNDMIKRKVIEKVGYPDNSYKFGMHDIDYSERVRRAGYKIVLNPKVHVKHLLSSYQRSLRGHLRKAWQYGYPSSVILKRYGYLPNLDNFLFAISLLLFFFSLFVSSYFLLLALILGVLSLISFKLEQPNFYGRSRYLIRAKKLLLSFIAGLVGYLLFHPLFFIAYGGVVILYRTLSNTIVSYKELKDLKVSLLVLLFFPIWSLINGFSVLGGFFTFLLAPYIRRLFD
jgi:GT2 family glycosyltransferase